MYNLEESAPEQRTSIEKESFRKLMKKEADGTYTLSVDAVHALALDRRIGQLVNVAMMMQAKIDRDPLILLEFNTLTDILTGINCHKTALFVRGDITFEHLKSTSIEAEHGGLPEVIDLAKKYPNNLAVFSSDVAEYVRAHPDQLPCSVHVLVKKGAHLIPAHSGIFLGVDSGGNDVVFHKSGPYMDSPFEVTTFKEAFRGYDELDAIYLIAPLNKT